MKMFQLMDRVSKDDQDRLWNTKKLTFLGLTIYKSFTLLSLNNNKKVDEKMKEIGNFMLSLIMTSMINKLNNC